MNDGQIKKSLRKAENNSQARAMTHMPKRCDDENYGPHARASDHDRMHHRPPATKTRHRSCVSGQKPKKPPVDLPPDHPSRRNQPEPPPVKEPDQPDPDRRKDAGRRRADQTRSKPTGRLQLPR